jgi:hypothetical protein
MEDRGWRIEDRDRTKNTAFVAKIDRMGAGEEVS